MGMVVQATPSPTAATASIHIQPRRLMLLRQSTTTRRARWAGSRFTQHPQRSARGSACM